MGQELISKDEIAQELGVKEVTLREVFQYCQSKGYRLITQDRYFIIVEPMWVQIERDDRFRCALESLLSEVHQVSRHFNGCY